MIAVRAFAVALTGLVFAASAAQAADGRQIFLDNCSACHQVTGKGVPGAFPALAGSKIVGGPGPGMATVVLNGRGGMPAFRDELGDADLAAVMTYVRASFGNRSGPVTPAIVASVRKSAKREDPKSALTAH
jgi:mono/diheme cytochrome c family protein